MSAVADIYAHTANAVTLGAAKRKAEGVGDKGPGSVRKQRVAQPLPLC